MCGPAATAGCNWWVQHTPPQAPTAPHSPPTEGNASREDAPFKTMTQGWRGNEMGGGLGRRKEREKEFWVKKGKLRPDRQALCYNLVVKGMYSLLSRCHGRSKLLWSASKMKVMDHTGVVWSDFVNANTTGYLIPYGIFMKGPILLSTIEHALTSTQTRRPQI